MTVRRVLRKQCQKSHRARCDIGPQSTHANSNPFIITDENVQDKTVFLISSLKQWTFKTHAHTNVASYAQKEEKLSTDQSH